MTSNYIDLMPPRVLLVDDEPRIHAAVRLWLGPDYEIVFCCSARDALRKLAEERFDLCITDINMPKMDGLQFIDAAREIDPHLGYVVLSAFDTDENLRRTIPLQVCDFIPKPLPDIKEFGERVQAWVRDTRRRRREHALAQRANALAEERDRARMERDVEFVASETARDGMTQAAGLLTTVGAHYMSACSALESRAKGDATLIPLLRAMHQGRIATEAVVNVTERFLGSAYGNRDSSPAFINEGIRDAINVASRNHGVPNKVVDFVPLDARLPVRALSGLTLLSMLVSAISASLALAPPNSTVAIQGEQFPRLDAALKDTRYRGQLWLNRRNALLSHPVWMIGISNSAPPIRRADVEEWLDGRLALLEGISAHSLIIGMRKCRGVFGFSAAPFKHFRMSLVLPS